MLLDKKLMGLSKIAAQDDSRPILASVRLENGKAVATDGFRLLEIDLPKFDGYQDELPPTGFTPTPDDKQFLIPAESFNKALGNIPNKPQLSVLGYAWTADQKLDGDRVDSLKIVSTDLITLNAPEVKTINGDFPDVEKIKPVDPPAFHLAVDIKRLAGLLEAIGKASSDGFVTLNFYDTLKPLGLVGKCGERKINGLLMPVRLDL